MKIAQTPSRFETGSFSAQTAGKGRSRRAKSLRTLKTP